jgi:hypothetical protein
MKQPASKTCGLRKRGILHRNWRNLGSHHISSPSLEPRLLNRRQEKSNEVWVFQVCQYRNGNTGERSCMCVCGREPRWVGQKPYAWVVCIHLGIGNLQTAEEGHEMKERFQVECPEMAGLVPWREQCAQTYMALWRGFLLPLHSLTIEISVSVTNWQVTCDTMRWWILRLQIEETD